MGTPNGGPPLGQASSSWINRKMTWTGGASWTRPAVQTLTAGVLGTGGGEGVRRTSQRGGGSGIPRGRGWGTQATRTPGPASPLPPQPDWLLPEDRGRESAREVRPHRQRVAGGDGGSGRLRAAAAPARLPRAHVPLPAAHAAGAAAPRHGAPRAPRAPATRLSPAPLIRAPCRPQVWGEGPGSTRKQPPSSLGREAVHFQASRGCVTLLLSPKGEVSADPAEGAGGTPRGPGVTARPSRP